MNADIICFESKNCMAGVIKISVCFTFYPPVLKSVTFKQTVHEVFEPDGSCMCLKACVKIDNHFTLKIDVISAVIQKCVCRWIYAMFIEI